MSETNISTAELRRRQQESQRGFFRALGKGSANAGLREFPGGVQATLVPAREWFSIFNSVLYRDPSALADAHDALADVYETAGVKAWTVWVPPGDEFAS